ncbi:MAG: SCP2 sterol-binding domain-containing protein [Candidatus Lokiarchaeota archaeon]|nr:SCP2 sterol-binding domain-containing protein [Candidatus Lokiarchaeota archaeon]
MNSSNKQKGTIQALNAYLITALLSLFIAGIFLILIGFFISFEQYSIIILNVLYQNLVLLMIIFGFILISLGAFESLVIMIKVKNIIDLVLERRDLSLEKSKDQSSGIGGSLRIIRPNLPVIESESIKRSTQSPKPRIPTHQVVPKETVPVAKNVETPQNEVLDISLDEALQKIVDRYNNPNVSKVFSDWQNTLMMTFPNLEKSYLFKINNDQGIILEEGYEEDAAVQVILDSDLYIKMMTKQINPIKAYSSGGLEVKGKMKNLLKLRKLMF